MLLQLSRLALHYGLWRDVCQDPPPSDESVSTFGRITACLGGIALRSHRGGCRGRDRTSPVVTAIHQAKRGERFRTPAAKHISRQHAPSRA